MAIEIEYRDAAARQIWKRKIGLAQILPMLEYETVRRAQRQCGLLFNVAPESFSELKAKYAADGMLLVEVCRTAATTESFTHFATKASNDAPFTLKCVFARNEKDAQLYIEADTSRDDLKAGALLGYPECCGKFFAEAWARGSFDPIFEAAENSGPAVGAVHEQKNIHGEVAEKRIVLKKVEATALTTSALRYIGVRVNSHFACGANCAASLAIAKERMQLASELHAEAAKATAEVLSLPLEWECLKGWATVSTQHFRFKAPSMDTTVRRLVRQA